MTQQDNQYLFSFLTLTDDEKREFVKNIIFSQSKEIHVKSICRIDMKTENFSVHGNTCLNNNCSYVFTFNATFEYKTKNKHWHDIYYIDIHFDDCGRTKKNMRTWIEIYPIATYDYNTKKLSKHDEDALFEMIDFQIDKYLKSNVCIMRVNI